MRLTQTIGASGVYVFNSIGKLFLLDSISGASMVDVSLLRSNIAFFLAPGITRGFRIFAQSPFDAIRLVGTPGTTISFFVADEDIQISTFEGSSVTVPGGVGLLSPSALASVADVAVNNGASAVIVAADGVNKEREVIIKNLFANLAAMRIGDNTVNAAKGHELAPGEAITLNTLGAVYAFNTGAAPQSVSVLTNSRA